MSKKTMKEEKNDDDIHHELPAISYEVVQTVADMTTKTIKIGITGKSLPECYKYITKCKALSQNDFIEVDE